MLSGYTGRNSVLLKTCTIVSHDSCGVSAALSNQSSHLRHSVSLTLTVWKCLALLCQVKILDLKNLTGVLHYSQLNSCQRRDSALGAIFTGSANVDKAGHKADIAETST